MSSRSGAGGRDVSGEGVQQALLKMLEGSVVSLPNRGLKLSRSKDMQVLFAAPQRLLSSQSKCVVHVDRYLRNIIYLWWRLLWIGGNHIKSTQARAHA